MDWFKICNDYYNAGYYNDASLKTFVVKNKINAEQYKTITKIDYIV